MKKIFVTTLMLLVALGASAQSKSDPVLFEIGNQKIHQSEFLRDFLQSQGISPSAPKTACTYEKRKAIEEYADLYYNYHLKLADAYEQKLDSTHNLLKELNTYRNELAAPYLMDSVTMDNLLHEAYERNKYILHASHILVRCRAHASAADTLKAYNEAMDLYRRVTTGGEDFNALALAYNKAQQEKDMVDLAQRKDDNGDLNTFSVFDMVYSFESAAYSLQPGQVSLPVRTPYGYHLVKLHEKTPFFRRVTLQHIWVSSEKNPEYAASKIKEAYQLLKEGQSFSTVAQNYSDDQSTAVNGGLLSDMTPDQIPPMYVSQLGSLKPGTYSEPFQTSYGWHIVFLNNLDGLPPYEELAPYYKQRMARDVRTKKSQDSFVEQCKAKYDFTDYTKMFQKDKKGKKVMLASLDNAVAAVNDSVFRKKWHYREDMVTDKRPLFCIRDKEYTTADLLQFIEANQIMYRVPYPLDVFVAEKYQAMITTNLIRYADAHLEEEDPDFAQLVNQYREGLMIFDYNDRNIWSKAIRDTAGLKEFYVAESAKKNFDNEKDEPYFWNERAEVTMLTVADNAVLDAAKAQKLIQKAVAKNRPVEEYSDILKDNMAKTADSVQRAVKTVSDKLEKGVQTTLSSNEWRQGIYVHPMDKGYQIIVVHRVKDPVLKSLEEARGFYMNDYQTYLEQKLVKELAVKYNAKFHKEVLDETTY